MIPCSARLPLAALMGTGKRHKRVKGTAVSRWDKARRRSIAFAAIVRLAAPWYGDAIAFSLVMRRSMHHFPFETPVLPRFCKVNLHAEFAHGFQKKKEFDFETGPVTVRDVEGTGGGGNGFFLYTLLLV